MKYGRYILLALFLSAQTAVRNIFEYDHDWKYADYEIVAHGHLHANGKSFKILHCGQQYKIIID